MCGLCRDCTHYEAYTTIGQERDTCERGFSFVDRPNFPGALAYGRAAEADHAELRVRPDFGCVSFQPKGQ